MSYINSEDGDPAGQDNPPRRNPFLKPPPTARDEDDVYYDLSDSTGAAKSKSGANPFAVPASPPTPFSGGAVSGPGQKPGVTPFAPPGWNDAPIAQNASGDRIKLYLGLGIISAAIFVLVLVLLSAKPPLVPVPIGFVPFTASDNSFQCQAPIGWPAKTRSLPGGMETRFDKKFASIVITSVPAGSSTIETLDVTSTNAAVQGLAHYKQLSIQSLPSEMGEGLISQWSAKGNLITKQMRGYRVTLLGHGRAITVLCSCSDRNWKRLRPAFFEVVSSIAPAASEPQ